MFRCSHQLPVAGLSLTWHWNHHNIHRSYKAGEHFQRASGLSSQPIDPFFPLTPHALSPVDYRCRCLCCVSSTWWSLQGFKHQTVNPTLFNSVTQVNKQTNTHFSLSDSKWSWLYTLICILLLWRDKTLAWTILTASFCEHFWQHCYHSYFAIYYFYYPKFHQNK